MGRNKIEINKKEFEKDYFSMRNEDVANKYNISHATVVKIAKEIGINKGVKRIELV